jgi:hypothetical protein
LTSLCGANSTLDDLRSTRKDVLVRRLALLATFMTLAVLAGPARAAPTPASVAGALRADPVYVAPGAKPTVTPLEAGRIRLRILRLALGRIHIAVLPTSLLRSAGSISSLTNAIDARLRRPGTLLVSAGSGIYLVVSYSDTQSAVAAVRRATRAHRGAPLGVQLLAAVPGLARADPDSRVNGGGPGGSTLRFPNIKLPDPRGIVHDVTDTFRIIGLVVGGTILLSLLGAAFAVARAVRRRVRPASLTSAWGGTPVPRPRTPPPSAPSPITPDATATPATPVTRATPVTPPTADSGQDEANRALGRPEE